MATSLQAQCADFDEPNPHTIQEEAPREHEHHLDELRRPHQIREEEDEVHKAELEQAQERPAVLVVREEAELGMCSTGEDQEDAAQEPEQQKEVGEQVEELQPVSSAPVDEQIEELQRCRRRPWMNKLKSSNRCRRRPWHGGFGKSSASTKKLCSAGAKKQATSAADTRTCHRRLDDGARRGCRAVLNRLRYRLHDGGL